MALLRRRPVLRAAAIGGGAYYAAKRRQEALADRERFGGADERGALPHEDVARRPARPAHPESAAREGPHTTVE